MLKTSAGGTLYSGQFRLSTQLLKLNYLIILVHWETGCTWSSQATLYVCHCSLKKKKEKKTGTASCYGVQWSWKLGTKVYVFQPWNSLHWSYQQCSQIQSLTFLMHFLRFLKIYKLLTLLFPLLKNKMHKNTKINGSCDIILEFAQLPLA